MAQEWLNVSDVTPRITYEVGATPQTAFVVPFIFFANADLVVAVDGVVRILGVHYTATGAGSATGGTITFLTPQSNCKVSIVRDVSISLDTHIPTFGPLDVGGINLQFSRLVAIMQEHNARTIQLPDNEGPTDRVLAPIATRKNRLLGFDTNGAMIYPLGPSYVSETVIDVANVGSRALAELTSFPVILTKIITGGFAEPGDGGEAEYHLVASAPSHPGWFQSADGKIWEIGGRSIGVRSLGVLPGAVRDTEMANAIAVAAATALPLEIPDDIYSFTEKVDFSPLLDGAGKILAGSFVVFDFSSATSATGFPEDTFVVVDGGDLVEVGPLGADFARAARAITISTPAITPQLGDILCIYNSVDGSFNAARSYYRAGELVRVASYSAGLAILSGSLLDSYPAATTTVYKHPGKRLTVAGGKIFIKEATGSAFNEFNSFKATRLADCDLSAFVSKNAAHAGHLYVQCIGIHGVGYHVEQSRRVGSDNYGMVLSNCQDVNIEGNFAGVKHAVTAGGNDEIGCIPNSHIVVRGTFRNLGPSTPGSGFAAVNFHGNTRDSYAGGFIDGSVTMGGNRNGLMPNYMIQARGDSFGIAILLTEMLGHDFNFSGGTIIADGNPAANSNATIDIGANGNGANANTKFGGTIRVENCTIIAPGSARPFICQNQGYVGIEAFGVSLAGSVLRESSASPVIVVAAASGNQADYFDVTGFRNIAKATYSVGGVKTGGIRGWKASGKGTISPTTSVSVATQAIVFDEPCPGTPICHVVEKSPTTGGSYAHGYPADGTETSTGFTAAITTNDGSTFAGTAPTNFNWTAHSHG